MDLGRFLRRQVRAALERGDGVNVAAAVNVDEDGVTTVVSSDDDVAIVQTDRDEPPD